MVWGKSEGTLLESDVICWLEAIWPPSRSRRKKPRPWGKQKVVAQIESIDGEFVRLKVLTASITENTLSTDLKPHKSGIIITKKRATLLRGNPERLYWSEEDVRTALLAQSVFL
jgi:hypothetical protein